MLAPLFMVLLQVAPPRAAAAQLPRRPDVRGLRYAVAESLLRQLHITVIAIESTGGRVPGIVVAQSPAANTPVRRGSVDTLFIARHSRDDVQVQVPDVTGRIYAEAVRVLGAARLVAAGPRVSAEDSATARVANQSPGFPGPAPPGSAVKLTISRMDPRVPPVVGMDTSRARRELARADLRPVPRAPEFSDRVAPGIVIHQDPAPGVPARAGSDVVLRISKGPHPPEPVGIDMPRLIGLTLDEAKARVERLKLRLANVDTVPQPNATGRVAGQHPDPGVAVHAGDAAALIIAVAPPTRMVPPLIGRRRQAAEDTLRALGFGADPIRFVEVEAGENGVVLGQSEPPGRFLPVGSAVGIDVSTRPDTFFVVVPGLVGLGLDAAGERLLGQLTVRSITRLQGAQGIVLEQDPDPGVRVPRGSAIDLVVGRDVIDSAPPQPLLPTVPDVHDSVVPAAEDLLRRRGFVNVVVDSSPVAGPVLEWRVAEQAPEAGTSVLASTLIRLTAAGIPGVPVPDLVDREVEEDSIAVASAGLTMRIIGTSTGLRFRGRIVRTQSPGAGTLVPPGTPVGVTVVNPLPFIVTAGAGLAGIGLAGVGARRVRNWIRGKPDIEVDVEIEDPRVGVAAGQSLIEAEASWIVEVAVEAPQLSAGDTLIAREESHE